MKDVYIHVQFASHELGSHVLSVDGGKEFVITIDETKNQETCGASREEALVHELGHIVAFLCGYPASLACLPIGSYLAGPTMALSCEHEAWDMAEKLLHFAETKRRALQTYQKNIE